MMFKAMKRNLISFAAITAVLFAAVSCQVAGTSEVNDEPQNPNFIITAGQPDTKTYFEKDGETYKSYWKGDATQGAGQGDMIRVYVDSNMGNQYRYDNKAENGAAARFEYGTTVATGTTVFVDGQEYTLYGFHRNGRAIQKWDKGEQATETTVAVEMLATQNPVSTSNPAATGPDGSSDFLIMKPVKFIYSSAAPTTLEAQFARISSVLRVKFVDKTGGTFNDYLVKNISIEAATKNLAGPAIVDLCENGGFLEHAILDQVGSKTASKKITVNYNGSISAKDGEMFFDMVPETYENETFTVTANLYKEQGGVAVISKSFTLATLAFKPGVITSLNLSVKDENITFAEFEGEGTNGNPYLIYNEHDLRRLSELTNGVDAASWVSKTYRQEQDITLSDDNFTPIAQTQTVGFTGTYNGQDKIISNLHIAVTANRVHNIGLFGTIKNPGRIIRVVVDDASISTTQENNFVGVLVGLAQGGTIDRCHVKNSTNTNTKNPAKGLILGGTTTAATTVKDCSVSKSSVSTGTAGSCVGGIVGRAGATITITGCVVGSDCNISGGYNLGGILGATHEYKLNVTIDKCVCYADITANNTATASSTGGIVGNVSTNNSNSNAQKVVISNCAYIGGTITSKYTGNGNVGVGGIVGKAGDGTNTDFSYDIINCQSSPAKLDASKTTANSAGTNWGVGGITGAARRIVNMYGCYCSTIQTNMLGGAAPHNGSVAPKLNTNSTAKYCFGQFTLVSDLSGTRPDATSEIVTAEKMTAAIGVEGALIDKLNAAKAAYAGGKATLVDWVRGTDGYPTLSGILADPDAAK